MNPSLSTEQLSFLAKLPVLLNCSLDTRRVITIALEHLKNSLSAEAATVFLFPEDSRDELVFWALRGEQSARLVNRKIPARAGVVGWVIERGKPALVLDTAKDPRFFAEVDQDGGFRTKDLICVPLIRREEKTLGAIQVLNKADGSKFSENDVLFVTQFAHQAALAIDNARLFELVKLRNHQLAVINRRKDDIISVVSHEFATPINIVQNAVELLSTGSLADQDRSTIERMLQENTAKLIKLIAEIRNAAAVSANKLELGEDSFSVHAFFDDAISRFKKIAERRELNLETSIDDNARDMRGDRTLLLVVMGNLISNAIRFTPNGGQVQLRAESSPGAVILSVIDSGIGFEESQIPLIFETFYEVSNVFEHSSGDYEFKSCGLGLGLAVVQAILQAHGVSIEVRSTPAVGSKFSFQLPVGSIST